MELETIVQARIPTELLPRLKTIADAEGLKVGTWLRRLILKEVNGMRIEAWVDKKSSAVDSIITSNIKAHFFLEPVQVISGKETQFRLLEGPGGTPGAPITPSQLSGFTWAKKRGDYRFFLRGSQERWSVEQMYFDEVSRKQLIVLRTE